MSFEKLREEKEENDLKIWECETEIKRLEEEIERLEKAKETIQFIWNRFMNIMLSCKHAVDDAEDWEGSNYSSLKAFVHRDGDLHEAYDEYYSDHIGDILCNISIKITDRKFSLSDKENDLIRLRGRNSILSWGA